MVESAGAGLRIEVCLNTSHITGRQADQLRVEVCSTWEPFLVVLKAQDMKLNLLRHVLNPLDTPSFLPPCLTLGSSVYLNAFVDGGILRIQLFYHILKDIFQAGEGRNPIRVIKNGFVNQQGQISPVFPPFCREMTQATL